MKAKELQIFDWVSYKGNPIMVFEIDEPENNINTEQDGYNAIRCISIDEIQPIPITPTILERNGFEKNGSYFILNECIEDGEDVIEHYEIIYYNDGFCSVQNIVTEDEISFYCPNVHQLQQAMRLCGIEKEIII